MPLHDHAKFDADDPWSTVHGAWAVAIMARLNKAILSRDRYKARSDLHLGTRAEVDVGALERARPAFGSANGAGPDAGGVAVAPAAPPYAPPAAALTADFAFSDPASFAVRVLGRRDGWRLVAAIELVSESNKDRDETRRTFAVKCAGYLQQGVSVVVVDVVTNRLANLHATLCDLLDLPDDVRWASPTNLSAVCYRTVQGSAEPGLSVGDGRVRLDVWPHVLAVGGELPTVPLWLAADLAVPLELDLTYAMACDFLGLE